jgi:hypothetical protein
MNRLSKLIRLSWRDRLFLAEATFWLGIARSVLCILPFRRIAPHLGHHMANSPETDVSKHKTTLKRISWAIVTVSRYAPWDCKCLVQAIAGKRMLQIRGLPSTLYLGVSKDEAEGFSAHAWLRCGEMVLTGSQGKDRFTVVSTFAERGPLAPMSSPR